jgi:hypothetical protein
MADPVPAGTIPPVPSLAVAINGLTPVAYPWQIDSINYQSVQEILRFVNGNLAGGLRWAWDNPDGSGNITAPDSLDEQWARLITEMLLFIPYQGPNNYGFVVGRAEKVFYGKMVDINDPAYPIVACCQQLATMGGITRGFSGLAEHDIGATSADNVETVGGKVIPKGQAQLGPERDTSNMPLSKLARALSNNAGPDPDTPMELTPGSCYVRTGFDHVAFLLRVDSEKRLIQFFDTGAMTDKVPQKPWPRALFDMATWPANYDYNWQPDVYQGLKHWGFLPRDEQKLKEAIDRIRTARPIGLARLVLRDRKSGKLVFATPLLLMHGPELKMNFSIARFMWALRHMPGREQLEGLVLIFIPHRIAHSDQRKDDQTALMLQLLNPPTMPTGDGGQKKPREASLREMVAKVRDLKGQQDWSPACFRDYKCITIIHTMQDLRQKDTTWTDPETKKKVPSTIWQVVSGSFEQGLVGVRHREVSPPGTGTTVWSPNTPGDLSALGALPWDQPSFGKGFGSEEDWQKLDWTGFEYFKGSWDGTRWNAV